MKKTIAIIALSIFFAAFASAHEVSAEFGFLPRTDAIEWNQKALTSQLHVKDVLYLDLGVRFDVPYGFFVGGAVKTYMLPQRTNWTFYPFFTDYQFGLGWSRDWLTIGYEHDCAHSIEALGYIVKEPILGRDCSSDKVFVKVTKTF